MLMLHSDARRGFLFFSLVFSYMAASCANQNDTSHDKHHCRPAVTDDVPESDRDLVHKTIPRESQELSKAIILIPEQKPESDFGKILAKIDYYLPCLVQYVRHGTVREKYLCVNLLDIGDRFAAVAIEQRIQYHIEFYFRFTNPIIHTGPNMDYYALRHLDGLKENRLISIRLLEKLYVHPETYLSEFAAIDSLEKMRKVSESLRRKLLGE